MSQTNTYAQGQEPKQGENTERQSTRRLESGKRRAQQPREEVRPERLETCRIQLDLQTRSAAPASDVLVGILKLVIDGALSGECLSAAAEHHSL